MKNEKVRFEFFVEKDGRRKRKYRLIKIRLRRSR
jgi:hypothetical protein